MSYFFETGRRVYEDEYDLAERVGRIVGSKMVAEDTRIVKLRVRPNNELTNWFSFPGFEYQTSYGGWHYAAARKCFRRELFYGWAKAQPDTDELWTTPSCQALRIVRTKYTLMFINMLGLPLETYRTVVQLADKLTELEQLEAVKARRKKEYVHSQRNPEAA